MFGAEPLPNPVHPTGYLVRVLTGLVEARRPQYRHDDRILQRSRPKVLTIQAEETTMHHGLTDRQSEARGTHAIGPAAVNRLWSTKHNVIAVNSDWTVSTAKETEREVVLKAKKGKREKVSH
jgi:hypothetical protein